MVHALVRDVTHYPFDKPGIRVFHADLPDSLDETAFQRADFVIHAAYATTANPPTIAMRVNEGGTARVLAAARSAGVARFVFVSSLAAHAGARSYYGRSKHMLEQQLDYSRDLTIRPGLILARHEGLFERLRRSVEHSPVVPLFGGGLQILQTVHVDDLCEGFERALLKGLTGTLNIAEPGGITMREFLEEIARRLRRNVIMVPLPGAPALWLLRSFERLRIPLPVTSENLLGLLSMQHADTASDLARLGLTVRDARQSLAELI